MHNPFLRVDDAVAYSSGITAAMAELIPTDYFAPLDLALAFPRPAPLEIDLGCGDGTLLAGLAEKFPQRNFLGIERLVGRVQSACGKVARARLPNVRILRIESTYAVKHLLPSSSIGVVHLLFPDPWPKKRHHRRRIVTGDFLAAVHRILVSGGTFRIATDQGDYFEAIRKLVFASAFQEEVGDKDETFPLTTFEKQFVATRAPIYRLRLRKPA